MDPKELQELIDKSVPTAVAEALKEKLPEFVKAVQEGAAQNAAIIAANGRGDGKKSVMRSADAGQLAWRAPFVEAGEDVKKFVNEMRYLAKGYGKERAADFNIANDEEGGYLVPEEVDMAIFAYERQVSVIRSRGANQMVAKGNTRSFNKLDQSTNSFGGVTFLWVEESAQGTRTQAKVGRFTMTVKKMMALTTQTSEFLQDSDTSAANFLIQLFGEASAYAEDLAFFQGDGLGKPQGIINYPGVQTVARTNANQVNRADIEAMYFKIRPELRGRATWFANTDTIKYISGLVDGAGRPLMAESTLALANYGTPTVLKGLPLVELSEAYLPALGSKGDLILVVLPHYYILDKAGFQIAVSPHSRFEYDEIEWRFTKRVDGQLAGAKSAVVLDIP